MASFLLRSSPAGIADNGDYWRVMFPAGISFPLAPWPPPRVESFSRDYSFAPPEILTSSTSAAFPAFFAAKFSSITSSLFDIRILGALYLFIFISGLIALTISFGCWIFSLAFCWLAIEPSHFLYFNSFYSQSLSLALWPWLLWSLLATFRKGEKKHSFVLAATALLIATSKLQLVLVPLLLILPLNIPPRKSTRLASALLFTGFLSSLAFSFLPRSVEMSRLSTMNRYQAVFTGIAAVADNPGEALSKIGVNEEYHFLAGRSLMEAPLNGKIPSPLAFALQDITSSQLAWSYLTNSGALKNSLIKLQLDLATTPMHYLGNFTNEAKLPGKTLELPLQYSNFRDPIFRLMPILPWLTAFGFICYFVVLVRQKAAFESWHCLAIFLLLNFLTQLPVSAVGDGFISMQRHLLIARWSLDLLLWLALGQAISAWFRPRLKAK
jgi:hypothetical protein